MKISDIEVSLVDYMGSDLSVVNAARVSFDKASEWEFDHLLGRNNLSTQDAKLVQYLAKHKHFSPFNHAFITTRIKAPIFVARQLVKHKFMPWNEISRRYVDSDPEFFFPDVWRAKAENVKQGSSDEAVDIGWLDHDTRYYNLEMPLDIYRKLLNAGVCPEQARMVLPQNTMTEWVWSGTLGAYADMLKLRLDPHTQYESRIVAEKIRDAIQPLFPVSLSALLAQE